MAAAGRGAGRRIAVRNRRRRSRGADRRGCRRDRAARAAPPIWAPGIETITVRAVDVAQLAAEKLHAYARIYAADRPSSRVKDLVDLVLLHEAGLLADPARLKARLVVVWAARDRAEPARVLPAPPRSWAPDYAAYASQLGMATATVTAAYGVVASIYAEAIDEAPNA